MSNSSKENRGQWQIKLLGEVVMTSPTGEVFLITRNKPAELLAYLSLNREQNHSRAKVSEIIWGNTEVDDTRARLRQELSWLNTRITGDTGSLPVITSAGSTFRIADNACIDVHTFLECCSFARQTQDLKARIGLLEHAVSVYQGELLCGSNSSWIVSERMRLQSELLSALQSLASAHIELKAYPLAEVTLRHVLRLKPGDTAARKALDQLTSLAQHTERQIDPVTSEHVVEVPVTYDVAVSPARVPYSTLSLTTPNGQIDVGRKPGRLKSFLMALASVIAFVTVINGAVSRSKTSSAMGRNHSVRTAKPISYINPQWTFTYAPRTGELPNSEAKAILGDKQGFWVTGIVHTAHDDTDILTLRINYGGKVTWLDRYSSPEHDCDRAFALCADSCGGIFVAGETYVPDSPQHPGSWRLVVIHYDGYGHRAWVWRSTTDMHDIDEKVEINSDSQGGCYVGGTAKGVGEGREQIAIVRLDAQGKQTWSRTITHGWQTTFKGLATRSDGTLFVCGTTMEHKPSGEAHFSSLASRVSLSGDVAWMQLDDGPDHGGEWPCRIGINSGGEVLVGGAYQGKMPPDHPSTTSALSMIKYSAAGQVIWRRYARASESVVIPENMFINAAGTAIIGGTVRHSNGFWNMQYARFDSFGNLNLNGEFPAPIGFASSALRSTTMSDDESFTLVGDLGFSAGTLMRDNSVSVIVSYQPDGQLSSTNLFKQHPGDIIRINDFNYSDGPVFAGKTQFSNNTSALTVIRNEPGHR